MTLRRAGARWRVLVHGQERREGRDLVYGTAHHLSSYPMFTGDPDPDDKHAPALLLEGTVFDELVVGSWIHVEQTSGNARGDWWMTVGGVTLLVAVDRDGRPRHVAVFGPGDYGIPFPGCTYDLHWGERRVRAPWWRRILRRHP